MVKIRTFQFEDRYLLEKLIKAYYSEKKITPPDNNQILETIAFYSGYPQCGKILIILFENNVVGYCIVSSVWKNRFSQISYIIEELFIEKKYNKHKLEINLIEYMIKNEKIHSISVKFNQLSSNSRNALRSIKFESDSSKVFYKVIEL